ncbi:RNA methyltransferase [soil metagenome]
MGSVEVRISSAQNPRFRAALELREGRARRRQGRILIDGLREIGRALDAGVVPLDAWLDPDRLADSSGSAVSEVEGLIGRLRSAGCPIIDANARLIDRLGYGQRSTGLVLVAETPARTLEELDVRADSLIGVVEGVEKPGNLGAILRSADGAGVSALLVADPATDIFNPNVIRASLGTVFSIPIAVASVAETMAWLNAGSVRIVTARVNATTDYTDLDMRRPVAIVLGNEAEGLGDAWSGPEVTAVRVPMLGVADSLNVSVTAGILFYEALRQRRASGAP